MYDVEILEIKDYVKVGSNVFRLILPMTSNVYSVPVRNSRIIVQTVVSVVYLSDTLH
jgi:hypothetical protein